eukprot:3881231-Prymnesium_polylepis.1
MAREGGCGGRGRGDVSGRGEARVGRERAAGRARVHGCPWLPTVAKIHLGSLAPLAYLPPW